MDPAATERTARLLGSGAVGRIAASRVLVLGLGGVGSWCVEALVRAGVGHLGLLDCDEVAPSNLNRQLGALVSTIGRRKTDVIRDRVLDINPDAAVETFDFRYEAATAERVDLSAWDAVVDAIDLVSSKILLAERCVAAGVPLYVAMGGGNKLDPARFEITDLSRTDRCPLAKVMRKKLRRRGIEHLTVVASREEPRFPIGAGEDGRHQTAGTISYVTGEEGLLLAHAVLADLMGPVESRLRCAEKERRVLAKSEGA